MRSTARLLVPVVLLAACYNPKIPDGTQMCGPGGVCAAGYSCAPDGRCHKSGSQLPPVPDLAVLPDLAALVDLAACTQASCAAPLTICDPDSGQCVACLIDSQCPDGKLCVAKQCVSGCSAMHGCGDAGGACDLDAGVCQVCLADGDCGDPANPRCDAAAGRCVPCLPAADNCPADSYCQSESGVYSCVKGCKTDDDCRESSDGGVPDGGAPGKSSCCDHVCVDLAGDATHCGACGTACAQGGACCAGACTDPMSDLANCGACGQSCGGMNAAWTCDNGACAVAQCNGTFRDCNGDPRDGCEVNSATDPMNCLGCNNVCAVPPNAVPACVNACGLGMCNPGFADCDGNPGDGCEVDTRSDPANCGGCRNVCSFANAVAACVDGTCAIGGCNGTFKDCNGIPGDGCEADVSADPMNCLGCGNACVTPNAAPACNKGCAIGLCNNGFADCDKLVANGCEVDIGSDIGNCGACTNKCAIANGVPACVNGVCAVGMCNPGFGDCDAMAANGCETALDTDPRNCGACGNACGGNTPVCIGGRCGGAASCLAIKQGQPNAANGTYAIDPDGAGPLPAVQVYCDMNAGGQTIYHVTHSWGEWGANMTMVIRDLNAPATGSLGEWQSTCALFGKGNYQGSWHNNGGTYSEPQYAVWNDSRDWWNNDALKVMPSATYDQILILQDSNTPDCWAWYAEAGSLSSFGSPQSSGYAFCRGGAGARERYHIYICTP